MLEMVRTRDETHAAGADDAWDDDDPHRELWLAVRHLFPAHAMACQTDYGMIMVSWTLRDGRLACTHYAAPILLRIEPGLLLALWTSTREERRAIARLQAHTVREALSGYDPHSRIPSCGVIALGE